MKRLALLIVALMLGSGVFAQKMWRGIEVGQSCRDVQQIVSQYQDVQIREECDSRDFYYLNLVVEHLFSSRNVEVSVHFRGNRLESLYFLPEQPNILFIDEATASFTEAYGKPSFNVRDRYITFLEKEVGSIAHWKRSDGVEVFVWAGQAIGPTEPRLHVVAFLTIKLTDADQF